MAAENSGSTVGLIKDAADAAKSLIIIMAILLVVFGHRYVDIILNKYNVTKLDFGGVTIDRGKAIESLALNADKLPQAEAALRKTAADLQALQGKHNEAVQTLEQTRAALALAQVQLAQSGGSEASQEAVSAATEQASATIAESKRTQAITQATVATAQRVARSTQVAVRNLPRPAGGVGGFAVVFGGDESLDAARDQIRAAQRRGVPGTIYLRQNSFRSVSVYGSAVEAAAATAKIAGINRYATGAYVVNLRSWCPSPEQRDGYSDCGI